MLVLTLADRQISAVTRDEGRGVTKKRGFALNVVT
jgi:hypothetical protein